MVQTRTLLRIIEQSCEFYAGKHRQFPTSEEQVITAFRELAHPTYNENIQQGVLLDSWGRPIECTLEVNKVVVRSAGPDGKFNTKDDLTNAETIDHGTRR